MNRSRVQRSGRVRFAEHLRNAKTYTHTDTHAHTRRFKLHDERTTQEDTRYEYSRDPENNVIRTGPRPRSHPPCQS